MPGTFIRDTLAPTLQSGTLTTTTTGAAVQVDRPGKVRFKLTTATVTGTTPTLNVEIQACDVSGFGSGVVSLGRFTQVTASNAVNWLQAYCGKKYVRAVMTVAGTTPSFGTTVITANEPNYQRTRADT